MSCVVQAHKDSTLIGVPRSRNRVLVFDVPRCFKTKLHCLDDKKSAFLAYNLHVLQSHQGRTSVRKVFRKWYVGAFVTLPVGTVTQNLSFGVTYSICCICSIMTHGGFVKSSSKGMFTVTFPNFPTLPSKVGHVSASEDIQVDRACFGIDLYPGGNNEANKGSVVIFLSNRSDFEVTCDFQCEIMNPERPFQALWMWKEKDFVLQSGGRVCWPRLVNCFITLCADNLIISLSLKLAGEEAAMVTSDGSYFEHACGAGTLGSDLLVLLASNTSKPNFHLVVRNADERQLVVATGRKGARRDATIPAHKLILTARSPVFRAMLSSGMKESCADEMEITGYAVEAVRAFVRFLHTDECTRGALEEHGWELLALADKYDVPVLRRVCEAYIAASLTLDTAFTTLQHADLLNASSLKKRAMKCIIQSAKALTRKPQLLDELSAELLREVLIAVAGAK